VVLVTGDDEDNRDRQVMVSHIRQPQRGLRMEATQEGENRTPRPELYRTHEHYPVYSVSTPVASEEWLQSFWVR